MIDVMARLMRLYGGTISDWMNVPVRVLLKFVKSAGAMEAESHLRAINAACAPYMKAADRGRMIRRLRKVSGGGRSNPESIETAKHALVGMGIGVVGI